MINNRQEGTAEDLKPRPAGEEQSLLDVELRDLYRHMFTAREIDSREALFVQQGEATFSVAGTGHEAIAALCPHLIPADFLHLHYRDKALMLARGVAPETFFLALLTKEQSPSKGRQMSAHLAERGLNILSLTGPVGNHALQAVGVAAEVRDELQCPIVVCSMGDGTSQQGEVMEAVAEAVRRHLPVLFVIEDNGLAISTRTRGQTLFDRPDGFAESFYGLQIHHLDGRDAIACYRQFGDIVREMRQSRRPAIVHFAVERLANHANSDDERLYRSTEELERIWGEGDPLSSLRQRLADRGLDVGAIETAVRVRVEQAARIALAGDEPVAAVRTLLSLSSSIAEYRGSPGGRRLTMLAAIHGVLRQRLQHDPRVSLYGQDIEDPKGDVFGLTRGLSTEFPGRVKNAPLSESTIVGTAIGRALAGGRPVAFLQFADFLPLAFNQIASEMGSLYWRTAGEWQCPVIVMIASGAYRPGLGPFHAQSLEALVAHVPGIDVLMPSTAGDAAGLLNAAFESGRPTLFFYPKNVLNDGRAEVTTSEDVHAQWVPPGRAITLRQGDDVTMVAWGNTVSICCEVADTLVRAGFTADVLDLRSIAPWDEESVVASVRRTGKLVVVHEANRTCGFGAEVVATALERAGRPLSARRVVRPDTYVPCHFGNQKEVLPSYRSVLTEVAELIGWTVEWQAVPPVGPGTFLLEAVGTAPSDRSVVLVQWQLSPGDEVLEGQTIVCLEGSKSIMELSSPVSGIVEAVLAEKGDEVEVGAPLARIALHGGGRPFAARPEWIPVIPETPLKTERPTIVPTIQTRSTRPVGIAGVAAVMGSRQVENSEILRPHWQTTDADITRRTGIVSRRRAGPEEDVVSLGAEAARRVLDDLSLELHEISLVICCTGSPDLASPSVACRILDRLGGTVLDCPAYDLSAACSGYLYGLGAAYDHLQGRPDGNVLLITSEHLSSLLDLEDPITAALFADAATATVLAGVGHRRQVRLELLPPYLGTRPEPGRCLGAPHADSAGALYMDGMKVFEMGVRCMTGAVKRACADAAVEVGSIDLLVPHQANQRILESVCAQLRLPRERLYVNLTHVGNTSSSSIPICLSELLSGELGARTLGLAAFGAGFTFGACILRAIDS